MLPGYFITVVPLPLTPLCLWPNNSIRQVSFGERVLHTFMVLAAKNLSFLEGCPL